MDNFENDNKFGYGPKPENGQHQTGQVNRQGGGQMPPGQGYRAEGVSRVPPYYGYRPNPAQTPPNQGYHAGGGQIPPSPGYQYAGGIAPQSQAYRPSGGPADAGGAYQAGQDSTFYGRNVPPADSQPAPGGYGQYGSGASFGGKKETPEAKPSKGGVISLKRSTAVIIAAIMVVVCAAAAVGGGFLAAQVAPQSHPVTSGMSLSVNPNGEVTTTEAVAKKVGDSVVGITSTYTVTSNNPFFGRQSAEEGGVGTGMILDTNGYILTNSHVIFDGGAEKIDVLLADGTTVAGKLIWNDSSIDLAIMKIDAGKFALRPVELGDSDKAQIGSYVAAIGNPLGLEFNNSITQGVISGLNRNITASDGLGNAVPMEGLIQVDAAINSGNSGGPLLNSTGQVIGINTAKASADGMGFAIPINTAKPIIDKVLKTGSFERVYMGVSAANASDISEQYPNLKLSVNKGAFITAVTIGSPADDAGLIMKDVITKVDGKAINGSEDLIKTLLNYSAGEIVTVTYIRDGKEATVKVNLKSQKEVYGTEGTGSGSDNNQADPYGSQSPDGIGGGSGSEEEDPFGWFMP